ncbi:unnamed protein product, partial [Effrenium voratum]
MHLHRSHAPMRMELLAQQSNRRQLVEVWDKNKSGVPTLQMLALRRCAQNCLLNPDFAIEAAERMPLALFEVLGDMANKVLADYVKKPSELKLDGAHLFDFMDSVPPGPPDAIAAAAAIAAALAQRPPPPRPACEPLNRPFLPFRQSWLSEKLGGHANLVSCDVRATCPFLDPEFHCTVRKHGEPKTPDGCPCELLHLQLYSKKPVVVWMRLLMQEKPGEKSERWLARALLHLALMNLGYNPWAAPEDNLQVVMFHFGLTVDALKELLVSICVPQQGAFQSALQCKWVSPYFRSSGSKPIKGWAASSDSESSSERQRAARVPSGDIRYPLLESPSFQWILREEVDQHMSPAVLRVLAVAKGINLCQADPERARRAARQLPEEVFADMERNAYRVAGSQLPCLSATYRQEVRVVDMLQNNAKRCPCKQVASCADRLYEHCRQNSLDSRTQTAQWMARCLLHCQKGWPREVTYDPDTARIIADEFLAHKFEVCDRTVKVLVDLTALGYDEGPMLLLDAADRQQDVAKASGALLEVAAQMSRLSLAKFALKLGAKVSVRCLCCAASAGHEELFDLTWSAVEKPYAVCMNLLLEGCRSGSVEIVRKILAACGRSDSVNCEFEEEKGLTSLYVAASWGYPDLVDFLLMQQANPQLVDVRGNTALRVAIALQETQAFNREIDPWLRCCG